MNMISSVVVYKVQLMKSSHVTVNVSQCEPSCPYQCPNSCTRPTDERARELNETLTLTAVNGCPKTPLTGAMSLTTRGSFSCQ